jgi:CxxC motif-containing protein
MTSRKYVCIICPNSCEIEAEYSGKDIRKITGYSCKKGEEYVRKEIIAPERGVTTTVPVRNGLIPLVSVKSSKAIPKELMGKAVSEIAKARADAPVKIGDVIVKNILGTDADIVATKDVPRKRSI